MFIGWIRKNSFATDIQTLAKNVLVDENLVLNTVNENQALSFGAYENNELQAFISAYSFDNSILINNFYYVDGFDNEYKKRLIKILLNNINSEDKTILFMASKDEVPVFKRFGFKGYANFKRAVYSGGAAAFNFSNATAKSISGENYTSIVHKLDSQAFQEDRADYITHKMVKSSSLFLSTDFGYQHSYALGKSVVKLSPWIMVDEAFTDAEKLLRGVIYHRGLKRIVSFIPKDVKEIFNLYESYNFEMKDDYQLIYANKKPNINLESIYGF
jgi:hypothetical protein